MPTHLESAISSDQRCHLIPAVSSFYEIFQDSEKTAFQPFTQSEASVTRELVNLRNQPQEKSMAIFDHFRQATSSATGHYSPPGRAARGRKG